MTGRGISPYLHAASNTYAIPERGWGTDSSRFTLLGTGNPATLKSWPHIAKGDLPSASYSRSASGGEPHSIPTRPKAEFPRRGLAGYRLSPYNLSGEMGIVQVLYVYLSIGASFPLQQAVHVVVFIFPRLT